MSDQECFGCRGEEPPEQPDLPIEEIEKNMHHLRSSEQMDIYGKWVEERPVRVQKLAREFPPFQMYLVKEGAPYKYTCPGSVVSPYKFTEDQKTGDVSIWFRVLRSPIGRAGVCAEIDPCWLKPISLEDLKKRVAEQEEAAEVNIFKSFAAQCPLPGETVFIQPDPNGPVLEVEAGELARANEELHKQWIEGMKQSGVVIESDPLYEIGVYAPTQGDMERHKKLVESLKTVAVDIESVHVTTHGPPVRSPSVPVCEKCGETMSHIDAEGTTYVCYTCSSYPSAYRKPLLVEDSDERITAGELRGIGVEVPEDIPDCADVPASALNPKFIDADVDEDGFVIGGVLLLDKPLEWISMMVGSVGEDDGKT